jgi:nitrogen fixation protein
MENLVGVQDMGKGDNLFIGVINVKWGWSWMFQELPYKPQLPI